MCRRSRTIGLWLCKICNKDVQLDAWIEGYNILANGHYQYAQGLDIHGQDVPDCEMQMFYDIICCGTKNNYITGMLSFQ